MLCAYHTLEGPLRRMVKSACWYHFRFLRSRAPQFAKTTFYDGRLKIRHKSISGLMAPPFGRGITYLLVHVWTKFERDSCSISVRNDFLKFWAAILFSRKRTNWFSSFSDRMCLKSRWTCGRSLMTVGGQMTELWPFECFEMCCRLRFVNIGGRWSDDVLKLLHTRRVRSRVGSFDPVVVVTASRSDRFDSDLACSPIVARRKMSF
mgnify:CR=1 FL=1